MSTPLGTHSRPRYVPLRPVRRFQEDHQMNKDEKPTPADEQLVWFVVAFIALMLTLLTLRSCL
jgi:hypothetical protein